MTQDRTEAVARAICKALNQPADALVSLHNTPRWETPHGPRQEAGSYLPLWKTWEWVASAAIEACDATPEPTP